jgi:two-component system sensor histidine kinase SenX3
VRGGVAATPRSCDVAPGTRQHRRGRTPAPPTAPRWSDVVDRLSLGVVVSGSSGLVHYRNRAARALEGTHMACSSTTPWSACWAPPRDGEESRQTLELYGPPRVAVVVRASPLEGGGAVATIEDVSERRRVDAVRTDFVANISHELKDAPSGPWPCSPRRCPTRTTSASSTESRPRMIDESHRVTHDR